MTSAITKINGKLAEQKVITVLQGGATTFADLLEITKLQKSSLSTVLRDLEGKGCIERKAVPRKTKVGRQRHYKLLIELTPELLAPEVRALWNLAHISPLAPLDLKKGTELLTDDIVNEMIKLKEETTDEVEEITDAVKICETFFKDAYELCPSKTGYLFNEYHLLRFLAMFNTELMISEAIIVGIKFPAEMVKFFKPGLKTFKRFPLLSDARKNGTMKQLEGLLDWIRPLIEPPLFTMARKVSPSAAAFKSIIVMANWNLAAAVFNATTNAYRNAFFKIPPWYKKMRSSKKSKKGKGGGEK